MSRSHVPITYENFEMLRELATRLCWENKLEQAFEQLEHAGYLLSILKSDDLGGELRYLSDASDITDDMSCIQERLGDNAKAFRYEELRLQTLTSFEDPLDSFLELDAQMVEEGGDEILVLRDAYSAMASFNNKKGVELQLAGQLTEALSLFEKTYKFLRGCSLFSEKHVQMQNTRQHMACVLRAMDREEEALQYDEILYRSTHDAAENLPYTNVNKIFFRTTPGGVPKLYPGTGARLGVNRNNKEELKRLVTKLLSFEEKPADGIPDTDKKRAEKKAEKKPPKSTQQGESILRVPGGYEIFERLRNMAKKLCHENKFSEALPHLEHAAYLLSQLNVREAVEDGRYADEAADIVDDMACILQEQGDYQKAFMYEMIRLQTLTGLESPLDVSFIMRHDEDDHGIYDQALTDTHSALFTILNLEALKMQRDGDLPKALKSFESALAVLERCFLMPDNYVQVRNTRRNMACVLRAMNQSKEAEKLEDERMFVDYKVIGVEVGPYSSKNKIFFRPVHGGAPQLYVPQVGEGEDTASEAGPALHRQAKSVGKSGDESIKEKMKHQKAFMCMRSLTAMEFARKTEEADRAMQELLEEEELAKKGTQGTQGKASKRDKKKKIKAKQAQERHEDAERFVQDLLQEQKDGAVAKSSNVGLCTSLLPLRLSPVSDSLSSSPGSDSASPCASKCLSPPPPPVTPRPSIPRPVPQRVLSVAPHASICGPSGQGGDMHAEKIAAHLEHFICPISLEIMQDPVITADGYTFERARIEAWFKEHNTNPLTNVALDSKALIPNKLLKAAIVTAQDLQRSLENGVAGAT